MLSTLRNAWKVPELKKRFLWTIFLVTIFRIGIHLPVPGIETEFLKGMIQSDSLLGFYDLMSGGAFSRFSIFALSVTPYINASIIMQLLTIAIPSLEQLSKEGENGKKKIQSITIIVSIAIGVVLAFGSYTMLKGQGATGGFTVVQIVVLITALVVGSTFCMWLGDQITVKGFGNGISILIFVNIISQLPTTAKNLAVGKDSGNIGIVEIGLFVAFVVALLCTAVYFSLAERKISSHL